MMQRKRVLIAAGVALLGVAVGGFLMHDILGPQTLNAQTTPLVAAAQGFSPRFDILQVQDPETLKPRVILLDRVSGRTWIWIRMGAADRGQWNAINPNHDNNQHLAEAPVIN